MGSEDMLGMGAEKMTVERSKEPGRSEKRGGGDVGQNIGMQPDPKEEAPALATLSTIQLEKLAAARLFAVRQMPYLATALYALQWRADGTVPSLSIHSGYALDVNPAGLDERSVPSLAAGLIHEVSHVLRRHGVRAISVGAVGPLRQAIWNIATDVEINDDLKDLPEAPDWWFYPSLFGAEEGKLAEEYYKSPPLSAAAESSDSGSQDGEGTQDSGSGSGSESGDSPQVAGAGSFSGMPDPQCGPGCVGGEDQDASPDVAGTVSSRSAAAITRQVAQATIEAAKSRGDVPGGLLRWAEDFLQGPQVDWRSELSALVRGAWAQVAGAVNYTFARPSRRSSQAQFPRAVLPSMYAPIPSVGVVIDTSGSMSQEDLGAAIVELGGILGSLSSQSVTVYACDAAVGEAQRVFDPRQVKLTGGGGTDMPIGIARAVDEGRAEVIVVLTDCLTPWPHQAPTVPVIVGGISVNPPTGVPEWAHLVHIPMGS